MSRAKAMSDMAKRRGKPRRKDRVGRVTAKKNPNSRQSKRRSSPSRLAEGYNLTDWGNAQRLSALHGHDLRYCYQLKKWLVWDGSRWVIDNTGEIERRAKKTVVSIYQEATLCESDEGRKNIAKHAMKSESRQRIQAMIELGRSEPEIPVTPEQLDTDPWLLNCRNGTLDLQTGKLRGHRREDMCTKIAPVNYDPSAKCPIWNSFLNKIMAGNRELIAFLQLIIGYSLTGDVSEQCFFIFWGEGANGKSTFLETVKAMLGDYAKKAEVATFLTRRRDSVRNDIARLAGARFVAAIEADEGERLAEALIKELTGGDTVTARFLYKEHFEFGSQFKLFLAVNHKPTVRGTDHAIWRRIRLVPFTVIIPREKQDRKLLAKLRKELPGILASVVRGCLAWQKQGLGIPAEITAATNSYRKEMDVVGNFLEDCCVLERKSWAAAGKLYAAYEQWCDQNGEELLSQKAFGAQLSKRGLQRVRGTGSVHIRKGIRLVTHSDPNPGKSTKKSRRVGSSTNQGSLGSPVGRSSEGGSGINGACLKPSRAFKTSTHRRKKL